MLTSKQGIVQTRSPLPVRWFLARLFHRLRFVYYSTQADQHYLCLRTAVTSLSIWIVTLGPQ